MALAYTLNPGAFILYIGYCVALLPLLWGLMKPRRRFIKAAGLNIILLIVAFVVFESVGSSI